MKSNRFKLLISVFLLYFINSFSQTSDEFWTKSSNSKFGNERKTETEKLPTKFEVFQLNSKIFKSKLTTSPLKKENQKESGTIMSFPNEDGNLEKFKVFEVSIMEESLQNKYPNIRSYVGKGVDNPEKNIRFSYTSQGLNAVLATNSGEIYYIDPYTNDNEFYIIYAKKNIPTEENPFECGTIDEEKNFKKSLSNKTANTLNANDGYLRTFRLAVAVTGEYSQYHLTKQGISSTATDQVKKTAVLSAIVSSITRVNSIYERDLSVTFKLIGKNDDIIFLNPATDNLTGNDINLMLSEGQSIIDNLIGLDNYDIGHVFSSGELGGLAKLNSVCTTNKARAATSKIVPFGDAFEGVVAHEMGHQFGASHTFNSCSSYTSTTATAVEPGSGSTLMGYPGVCTKLFDPIPKDIQMNTDFYFHSISIQQMWSYINSGGTPCASKTSSGNTTPVIAELSNYNVPISTPFILKAMATDNDGDNLTYTWEQLDYSQPIWPLVSTSTQGPAFRSLPPSSLSYRSFPTESTVLIGELFNFAEVLPSVTRTMKFGVTVRDNNSNGGQTASKNMILSFVSNSGPFKITSQTSLLSWEVASTQTITWDVANTDKAPINCSNVNILLSLDGGFTYPVSLASNIPNNGSGLITVPDVVSGGARIKVESVNNVFYSVNSDYILINPPADRVFVPDENFEKALIRLGYDSVLDKYVLKNNIKNSTSLILSNNQIANLKGIEGFENLEILKIESNKLTSIDISNNLNLKEIIISNNQIKTLDFTNNSKLEKVFASRNVLSSVDVSRNLNLKEFYIDDNQIKTLDFTNNSKLENVSAFSNIINSIDISKNTALKYLILFSNKLTNINVTNNPELLVLDITSKDNVNYNLITSLDVSKNFKLKKLSADSNKITTLDLTNNLYLETLTIPKNKLNSLDVSKNILLNNLNIWYNHISSLDVSVNTNLKFIKLGNNEITTIDFTKNINLEQIIMDTYFTLPEYSNSKLITSLDVTKNTKLNNLIVSNHKLTSLDVSKNTNLNLLNTLNNNLSCIQVNNNQLLNIPQSWSKDAKAVYSTNCSNLSVNEYIDGQKVVVYPNPATHTLNISSPIEKLLRIRILSSLGQEIINSKPTNSIGISSLSAGVYFLEIEASNNQKAVVKFVKN